MDSRDHPRWLIGERICHALALITAIYASLGERKLALKYAEELRNELDKAFEIDAGEVFTMSPWNEDLPTAFQRTGWSAALAFYDSANLLLKQVGADPYNPRARLIVRVLQKEPASSDKIYDITASSKEEFLAKFDEAVRDEI